MAVNRNWCRIEAGRLVSAPTWLKIGDRIVINPSDEQYLAAGWKRNAVQPPEPPAGQMVAATRYVVQEDRVVAGYEYAPVPKVPRVFSKLYLILALKKRGLYEQFMVVIRAAALEAEWSAAQDIAEDFPGFADYAAQIGAALGLTDAQMEKILGEAVER